MKLSRRVASARAEATTPPETPATETWVQTATGKVVPLAAAAAAVAAPLAQKAGPLAQGAVAKTVPLTAAAAAAVPLAKGAAAKVGPLTQQALGAVTPYAQQAAGAVAPYAQSVAGRVSPYTEMAAGRIAPLAATGVHAAHDAVGKVGPAVGAARDRVSGEVLPKLSTALTAAAASPLAAEAARRSRATVAAARGELTLPVLVTKKKPSWLKRFAVVAAVGGTVAVVARKLMGSGDSGWQAARPSAPASTPTSTPAPPPPPGAGGTRAGAPLAGVATENAESEAPESAGTSASTYGEGSYVGSEPPAGYPVKGNANSNKYHVPEGSGYADTVAEVWFDSPESAERAGFVRAQD